MRPLTRAVDSIDSIEITAMRAVVMLVTALVIIVLYGYCCGGY